MKEREAIIARHKEKADLLSKELEPEKVRPAFKPDKPTPFVKVNWLYSTEKPVVVVIIVLVKGATSRFVHLEKCSLNF